VLGWGECYVGVRLGVSGLGVLGKGGFFVELQWDGGNITKGKIG
jgi:hypothetical protein